MSKVRVFEKAFMCVAIIGFIATCTSCQTDQSKHTGSGDDHDRKLTRRPHQLGLACPGDQTQTPDPIRIRVDLTAQVLTDSNDSVIFACQDDKIVWYTTRPKTKITITIKSTNPTELFKSHNTTVVWDPDHHPSNATLNETIAEEVDKPAHHISLHKYSIDVDDVDPSNSTHAHFNIDPHVIPMGNGGP